MFKKSLLSKLLIGMLLSAVLPLAAFVIVSYTSTSDSVQRQLIDLNRQAMAGSMYNLKRYMDDLDQIAISFYYDPVMMGHLRGSGNSYDTRMYLTSQVYTISKERPEFRAARFTHSATGESFLNSTILQLGSHGELEPADPASDRAGWTETHGVEVVAGEIGRMLGFHKPVIDYPRSTHLGTLSLYASTEELRRMIRPFGDYGAAEDESVFLFVRGDSQLLYASEPIDSSQGLVNLVTDGISGTYGYREGEWKDQPGVIIYALDDYKGIPLSLVKFIPAAVVHEAANQALRQSLFVPLLVIGIVVASAILLFYVLISPVKRLVRSVGHVQAGNFAVQPAPERQDELGVLEHKFHAMVRGLDDMMNREYRQRLELSTARLKMLQAQINPHFLYNALQSISTLALRQGADEVNERIAELGSIMRYSMDLSTETVPLAREIEHIENYLSLQHGRFRSRLSYSVACPPEALKVEVPKMMLQPLAENSIVHGVEKGNGTGALRIEVTLKEALTIRVIDNGQGMTPETAARIRMAYGSKQPVEQERGIGLLNVLERLRLHFGASFSWDIRSTPYEETEVTLRVAWPQTEKPSVEHKEGAS